MKDKGRIVMALGYFDLYATERPHVIEITNELADVSKPFAKLI